VALTPGTRLGVYVVTAQIGEGGMGQVYRATDTKLKRQVAIKILPPSLAADYDRLARLQREAEVLAALNHPNIAAIYGLEEADGVKALVMELVEGEDLSQRIARGAIPLEEALHIAKQVATALEAAHEQAIVHRDLKPANIKVRLDGTVKILDFGLAKAMEPAGAALAGVAMAPTITTPAMTQAGVILGTAAYMAPEQARGKTVDKRADIWAFGAVLFEMLTGTRAFAGEDVSETLARVIEREPAWDALPAVVPMHVSQTLRLCLRKPVRERIPDIGSVRLALDGAFGTTARETATPVTAPRGRLAWTAFAVATLVAAALAVPAVKYFRQAPSADPVLRLPLPLPATSNFMALSPDGRRLAVTLINRAGKGELWLRPLDSSQLERLPGTEGMRGPFWSADGKSIGFFADGKLKAIPAAGGPPQVLCDGAGLGAGATWNRDGVILFNGGSDPSIRRVDAAGGACTAVTKPDGDSRHRYPAFLPDGKHFVYMVSNGDEATRGVYVASIDNPERRRLFADESSAIFAPSTIGKKYGYLLFLRANELMAQPFSAETFELAGDVFPVGAGPGIDSTGQVAAAVSAGGILVYNPSDTSSNQLTWLDRSGKALGNVGDLQRQQMAALSPDGKTVATLRSQRIELYDLVRGGETRLTALASSTPVWSPESNLIAFGSGNSLYLMDASGGSREERLLERGSRITPSSWSEDGRYFVYTVADSKNGGDIWYLPDPLNKSSERKPVEFLATEANEGQGQLSPDGHWLAYVSYESTQMDVYVRPFPSGPGRWKVSGGAMRNLEPYWRRDGKELFFVENVFPVNRLMAVAVQSGPRGEFQTGTPRALFEFRTVGISPPFTSQRYSPSADGQRFLVQAQPSNPELMLSVITNWEKAALASR
jgi:serine/threonine protein kinase/Tol biopolymer transport system component